MGRKRVKGGKRAKNRICFMVVPPTAQFAQIGTEANALAIMEQRLGNAPAKLVTLADGRSTDG
jgi:hypothetical protein